MAVKAFAVITGLGLGFTSIAVLTYVWWVAKLNGNWTALTDWNRYGEAILEGVLLHASLVFVAALWWMTPRWMRS